MVRVVPWEWRTWLHAEVDAEPVPPDYAENLDEPGQVRTGGFMAEADGRTSDRRVHKIATKYAPNGNYSISGRVPFGGSLDCEELRFALPSDEAETVLARIREEPGVRRAWLGDSFRDT